VILIAIVNIQVDIHIEEYFYGDGGIRFYPCPLPKITLHEDDKNNLT
jgi:hypothetical protein